MRKRTGGFTLLELMVVITVLAILAGIAFANYVNFTYRSRRSEGQQFLLQVAAAEERYFTNFNNYTSNVTANSPTGLAFGSNQSTNQYYQVSVVLGPGNQSYTLTATPGGPQTTDKCGPLTLTDQNIKGPVKTAMPQNSNGPCWTY